MKLKLLSLLLGTSWLSMAQTYTYSNGTFTTGTITKSGVAAPAVPS